MYVLIPPRFPFRSVRHIAAIVTAQARTEILSAAGIESRRIEVALQHIHIDELAHSPNVACRVVARSND
jgi:hypothetical protein